MAYQYENVKLEKGMYGQGGRSFAGVLEALDPSENYRGTARASGERSSPPCARAS